MAMQEDPSGTMPEQIPAEPIQEVVAVAAPKKRKPRAKKTE